MKETPNRINYSNSSKLIFTSSPSLPRAFSSISILFFLARERSNEYGDRIDTARKNRDCCLLSSSRKGPAYVFEILMAPTGWPPPAAGLQPIRAIGSPPGGRLCRIRLALRIRASTPVLLHRFSSPCACVPT